MSTDNIVQLPMDRTINGRLIGQVAEDVRNFLRSTWTGDDVPTDPEYLNGGRELIEDFNLRAAALADKYDDARRGQDLDLHEVAQVLNYLGQLQVRDGSQCYGCSGDTTTCGHTAILDWLRDQVVRHAEKQS